MNAQKDFRRMCGRLRRERQPTLFVFNSERYAAAIATVELRQRGHDPLEEQTHHRTDAPWVQRTMSRLRRAATRQLRAGRLP